MPTNMGPLWSAFVLQVASPRAPKGSPKAGAGPKLPPKPAAKQAAAPKAADKNAEGAAEQPAAAAGGGAAKEGAAAEQAQQEEQQVAAAKGKGKKAKKAEPEEPEKVSSGGAVVGGWVGMGGRILGEVWVVGVDACVRECGWVVSAGAGTARGDPRRGELRQGSGIGSQ